MWSVRRRAATGAVLLLAAAGVASAMALGTGPAGAATPASTSEGTLIVTPDTARVGDRVLVDAVGFPPDTVVNVQLCGDGGIGGSAACDPTNTLTAVSSREGHFAQYLVIGTPPLPCPCIIQAVSPGLAEPITAPITVTDLPSAPPHPIVPPASVPLVITASSLEGSGPWTSLFGGPATRTLVLTVRNPNAQQVTAPPLILSSGKAPTATDSVPAPNLGTIGPNQTKTFHIQVSFPPLAFGTYLVTSRLATSASGSTSSATTSLLPWALIVVVLLMLALLVFGIWWEIRYGHLRRRRLARAAAVDEMTKAAAATSVPVEAAAPGPEPPKLVPELPMAGGGAIGSPVPPATWQPPPDGDLTPPAGTAVVGHETPVAPPVGPAAPRPVVPPGPGT